MSHRDHHYYRSPAPYGGIPGDDHVRARFESADEREEYAAMDRLPPSGGHIITAAEEQEFARVYHICCAVRDTPKDERGLIF